MTLEISVIRFHEKAIMTYFINEFDFITSLLHLYAAIYWLVV